jgi:hypothetical protein
MSGIEFPQFDFDLNAWLARFAKRHMDEYRDPAKKRDGGFSVPYQWAVFLAMTTMSLKDQVQFLLKLTGKEISYESLKASRAKPEFKALLDQLTKEFAGEVTSHAISTAQNRILHEYRLIQEGRDGDAIEEAHAKGASGINASSLSPQTLWAVVKSLARVISTRRKRQKKYPQIIEQFGQSYHLATLQLYFNYTFPILAAFKKEIVTAHKRKRDADQMLEKAMDAAREAAADLILLATENPDVTREKKAEIITNCIKKFEALQRA